MIVILHKEYASYLTPNHLSFNYIKTHKYLSVYVCECEKCMHENLSIVFVQCIVCDMPLTFTLGIAEQFI